MNYSLAAFNEPRGVMRILQLIFGICAFATTVGFSATLVSQCDSIKMKTDISYPFRFGENTCMVKPNATSEAIPGNFISADVSTDAQFFVATGVLSLMYCIFIIAFYTMLDELYKSKNEIPLADFILTLILAIFWLSGSAAWSNGTSGLKQVTDIDEIKMKCSGCTLTLTSFSKLNISLVLGFLNFFLWGSDLWFLYKETIWFQSRQQAPAV